MAAHLKVYEIDGGIEWCISNLQSPFNDGYSEVGISWTPINDGSTTSPNIAARVYPTSSDSSHSSPLKQLLLEPGEYTFYGYALVNGKYWQTDDGSAVHATVTGGTTSVEYWNWYGTNETSISDHRNPASSTETQLAYSALTSKGPVSDFNHRVWNDMCFKCREVLAAKGFGREGLNGWSDYNGLDFEDTLMHTGNTEMTADRFNALRYNIGSRIVVDWDFDWSEDIQPGKPIKSSYFIDLAKKLNQFVDSI